MTRKWSEKILGDLIDIKHGFAFKGEFFRDGPPGDILLTPGNFAIGGGFRADKLKYYKGPVLDEFVLSEGDLIVTMTDLSKNGDTLGYPALIPPARKGRRYLHNQRLGKVVPKDRDAIDLGYLHYLMCTREYRQEVLSSATGTTVKHTSPERIKQFSFRLPSPPEQRAIGRILGTLDDKVELNRRMSKTLEAIARAIFKSWFVDFDPVRAKAEGRDPGLPKQIAELFPDRFEQSELGETPQGWAVSPLRDLASYLSRGIGPSYIDAGGICVLNQKCIRGSRVDFSKARRHDASRKPIEGRMLQILDIVVNSTGVGTLGRVAQLWDLPEPAIVDSHVTVIRVAEGINPWFLGIGLTGRESELEALGEGSTGQTELSRARLGDVKCLLPPLGLQSSFGGLVEPLLARLSVNEQVCNILASLRDALLPELISGELRVMDLLGTVSEVAS